jgi:hypothetical protein
LRELQTAGSSSTTITTKLGVDNSPCFFIIVNLEENQASAL